MRLQKIGGNENIKTGCLYIKIIKNRKNKSRTEAQEIVAFSVSAQTGELIL